MKFRHFIFFIFLGIFYQQKLVFAENSNKKVFCSKTSSSVICRKSEIFSFCSGSAGKSCLPVSDEPKLEKDGTIDCSCQKQPKDRATYLQILDGVSYATAVAAKGALIVPVK